MGRDAELNIVGHDRTGLATRSAERNLDRLSRKIRKANGDIDRDSNRGAGRMADSFDKASRRIQAVIPASLGQIAVVLAALPAVAAVATVGIVAALGAGLASIGVLAAVQNKKVRDSFSKTADHIKERAKDFGKPFEPVLLAVSRNLRRTFDFFAPTLQRALEQMAPHLQLFQARFFAAFRELEPAILPVTRSFGRILDDLGPRLPGVFRNIRTAITDVVSYLDAHPNILGDIVRGLNSVITATPKVLATLVDIGYGIDMMVDGARLGFSKFQIFATQFYLGVVKVAAGVVGVMAKIPGPWQKTMQSLSRTLQGEVSKQQASLDSIRTTDAQNQINVLQNTIRRLRGKKVKTEADQAAIEASKRKLAELQARINGLSGKSVSVYVKYKVSGSPTSGFGGGGLMLSGMPTSKLASSFAAGDSIAGYAGPPSVDVQTGPTNVDVKVGIDGRQLLATVRSTVHDEQSRAAYRARYGRRVTAR